MADAATKPKFLFDVAFDAETIAREERRRKPVGPPLVHTEQALVDAVNRVRDETRASAFAEGRRAGVAEIRDAIDVHVAKAQEAIARTLPLLADLRQSVALEARREATKLAVLIARKLAGALLARQPAVEIEAMIERTLAELGEVARNTQVIARVPPALVEPLAAAAQELVRRSGLDMRITVVGDASLSGSAARIEWPDGGAERAPQALEADIDRAVERYLALVSDLPEFAGATGANDAGVEPGTADVQAAVDGIAQAAEKSLGGAAAPPAKSQ